MPRREGWREASSRGLTNRTRIVATRGVERIRRRALSSAGGVRISSPRVPYRRVGGTLAELAVLETGNRARVRDGYISSGTRGHSRHGVKAQFAGKTW